MDGAMLEAGSQPRADVLDPAVARERAYRAARRVATEAVDAAECAELLAMLGLTAQDGKAHG
jgi:hypothetical protein